MDIGGAGVAVAARRVSDFVPAGQAAFRVGTFEATGLPSDSADGVVSVNAPPSTPNRTAAFAEIRRILRPDGRLVFTASEDDGSAERPNALESWEPLLVAAGLQLVVRLEVRYWLDRWLRLYALWLANEDELRTTLGHAAQAFARRSTRR